VHYGVPYSVELCQVLLEQFFVGRVLFREDALKQPPIMIENFIELNQVGIIKWWRRILVLVFFPLRNAFFSDL